MTDEVTRIDGIFIVPLIIVVAPHHFDTEPDIKAQNHERVLKGAHFPYILMRIRIQLLILMRMRIKLIKLMRIRILPFKF
jgi:hypothetical protein